MPKTCNARGCNNNVWGGGMCRMHSYLREDIASIKRERHQLKKSRLKPHSQKWTEGKEERIEEGKKMWDFMSELWNNLDKKECWSCGSPIYGENSSAYWHHLLPKSAFREFAYEKDNLYFCCLSCHSKTESGFPPEKIEKATERAKKQFL